MEAETSQVFPVGQSALSALETRMADGAVSVQILSEEGPEGVTQENLMAWMKLKGSLLREAGLLVLAKLSANAMRANLIIRDNLLYLNEVRQLKCGSYPNM